MTCALVLAAGLSRRMGTQKLLLPFGGAPLIAHVVDRVLQSPVDEVHVVVGRDAAALTAALAGRPVSFVTNPRVPSEMLDSLRCGLGALPERCQAVLLALGDQPGVTAALIGEMMAAFRDSGRGIVVPTHGGRRGHPLLFSSRYREEILTRFDDTGLRGLLWAHPEEVRELPCASPLVLADVDFPADYLRALRELPTQ